MAYVHKLLTVCNNIAIKHNCLKSHWNSLFADYIQGCQNFYGLFTWLQIIAPMFIAT